MPLTGLALLACVHAGDGKPRIADDTADTSSDTFDSADSDTSDSAVDSDSSPDSDTSDTSDTSTPVLPGSFSVTGQLEGREIAITCDESTAPELFIRYWALSLGNISGAIGCANEEGDSVMISFISPTEGEWTNTDDGLSWSYTDRDGTYLYYGTDSVGWGLAITTFGYVDTTTIEMDGTLTSGWATESGGEPYAQVDGTFAVELACSGGC